MPSSSRMAVGRMLNLLAYFPCNFAVFKSGHLPRHFRLKLPTLDMRDFFRSLPKWGWYSVATACVGLAGGASTWVFLVKEPVSIARGTGRSLMSAHILKTVNEFNQKHQLSGPALETKRLKLGVKEFKGATPSVFEYGNGPLWCGFSGDGKFLYLRGPENCPFKAGSPEARPKWTAEKALALGLEFMQALDPVAAGELDSVRVSPQQSRDGGDYLWTLVAKRKTAEGIPYLEDECFLTISETKGIADLRFNFLSFSRDFPTPKVSREEAVALANKARNELGPRATLLKYVEEYNSTEPLPTVELKVVNSNDFFSSDPRRDFSEGEFSSRAKLSWIVSYRLIPPGKDEDYVELKVWVDATTGNIVGGDRIFVDLPPASRPPWYHVERTYAWKGTIEENPSLPR